MVEKPRRLDSRGQSLVVIALFAVVLVAMAGVALDGGHAYMQRRRMQNAADAGALAGARALALGGTQTDAITMAEEYAVARNGADPSPVVDISADMHQVGVTTTSTFNTSLAAVIGIDTMTVNARAVAEWDYATGCQLAPIALYVGKWQEAQALCPADTDIRIFDSDKEIGGDWTDIAGANRGWLDLDCPAPDTCAPDAADLKLWMGEGGFPGFVYEGQYMGDVGSMTSVINELEEPYPLVTIPIYDYVVYYDTAAAVNPDDPTNGICEDPAGAFCAANPTSAKCIPPPTDEEALKGPTPPPCICTPGNAYCDSLTPKRIVRFLYTTDTTLKAKVFFNIVDFACFQITGTGQEGGVKYIAGTLICDCIAPCTGGSGGASKVKTVWLVD